METEKTLTDRILAITTQINKQFPELTKYITEMPDTNPNEEDPDINKKILKEYHDSLLAMVKKYKPSHLPDGNENHNNIH